MPIRPVPPPEAAQLVAQGYAFVDVRSMPEFAEGHPEGAENVPFTPTFPAAFAQKYPDKNAGIVLSCKMGGRSQRAAQALEAAGYTNLVNVAGGLDQWAAMGLPVKK